MKTLKNYFLSAALLLVACITFGQTNTFPRSGNVGIGRTNPESKLHIDGTGGAPSNNYSTLSQRSNLTLSSISGLGTNTKLLAGIGSSSYVWLQAFNSSSNIPQNISLNSLGGNVGIGRNNPESLLHIDGNGGVLSPNYTTLAFRSNLILSSIGGLGTNTKLLAGIGNSSYVWFQAINNGGVSKNIILNGIGGNVGIGTTTPDSKLTVKGKIKAEEVQVVANITADFVFEEDYSLKDLTEVDNYIKENKHLPEIASAKEMRENGVNMGNFQIQLLQKIEELTLYVIDLKKENESIKAENIEIKKDIEELKN